MPERPDSARPDPADALGEVLAKEIARTTHESRGMRRKRGRRGLLLQTAAWTLTTLCVFSVLPILALRWVDPPTTAFMLIDPAATVQWQWVPRSEIADSMALAAIAAEDQRFMRHWGIDAGAIRQAIAEAETDGRLRGASTITQQTVKNLFLAPTRSWVRKAVEAWLAVWMDLLLGKDRILEIYLNVIELGPGVYGVEAAAQRFFGVPASRLNREQAALLAAVLPAPGRLNAGRPSAYVRQRQQWILGQMEQLGQPHIPPATAR